MRAVVLSLLLSASLAGCGRKGDPVAPLSSPPEGVRDLRARLDCRTVVLSFTAPAKRSDGSELSAPLQVEVYRRRYQQPPPPSPAASPQTPETRLPAGTGALELPSQPGAAAEAGEHSDAAAAASVGTPAPPPATARPAPTPAGKFERLDRFTISSVASRPAPAAPAAAATQKAAATPRAAAAPQAAAEPAVQALYEDTGGQRAFELGYTYLYQVVVVDADGETSAPSNTARVDYLLPPAAPSGLAGEPTRDGVRLRWRPPTADCAGGAAPPVDGYNLYRRTEGAPPPSAPLNAAPIALSEYLDASAAMDRRHAYAVRAVTGSPRRESPASAEVLVELADVYPPEPPSGLVATRTAEGVTLLWNPSPSRDVAGYHVYREEHGGWSRLTSEPAARTSFLDSRAPARGRLRYRITAADRSVRANESPPTEAVSVHEP
jgi:hypothetical protein